MNIGEARLEQLTEEAARAVTDPDTGRYHSKEHLDEIVKRLANEDLAPSAQAASAERLARALAEGFRRRRAPKPKDLSTLFDPGAILSLGKGERVWMESAGTADLIEWGREGEKARRRAERADDVKQQYVAERVDALKARPGCSLGQIEREVFGWTEPEDPPEYDDFDDESE